MNNLNTKFAPYETQDIWTLSSKKISRCCYGAILKAIKLEDIEECRIAYAEANYCVDWYRKVALEQFCTNDLIASFIVQINTADDCPPLFTSREFGKFLFVDPDFYRYIESLVTEDIRPFGRRITMQKIWFMSKAMLYANHMNKLMTE
jgi:hypothetical protein